MFATATMHHSEPHSYVHTLESRLQDMESEVQDLLQWKQLVTTLMLGAATGQLHHDSKPKGQAKPAPSGGRPQHAKPSSTSQTLASKPSVTEAKELFPKAAHVSIPAPEKNSIITSTTVEVDASSTDSESTYVDSATTTVEGLSPRGQELHVPEPSNEDKRVSEIAEKVLAVIQSYGRHTSAPAGDGAEGAWLGKAVFAEKVATQIRAGQPVRMILPAFPWKSINRLDKVIGVLPDLGEVLALSRLDHLCRDVRAVYPAGGEIHLATDGLVFDDIVGISDRDTWAYSKALMDIVSEKGFKDIKLLRVMDIIGLTEDQELTEDVYYSLTQTCRDRLLAEYGQTEDDVRKMMKEDEDTLMTYRGFIRFLETDLKHSPIAAASKSISGQQYRKLVKKVAIGMMIRAESFTKLLQERCPGFVRLSIHPSSGSVKLSVPLIQQRDGVFPRTPWHSVCALSVKGEYYMGQAKELRDTHRLITHKGQPYYYRANSELWDWEGDDVAFEPKYPNTLHVYPLREGRSLSATELQKLHSLSKAFEGQLEVTGFTNGWEALADSMPTVDAELSVAVSPAGLASSEQHSAPLVSA